MEKRKIWILLIASFVVRLFMAATIELGNDEVYYRIFALFPDWSYFDHPPLTAWLIRLTTLASEQMHEILVRFGAVAIGTINTYLIYRIAGNGRQGYIAALLYTGSVYASVILGTFILPDTPLSLFWLLTLWIFKEILPEKPSEQSRQQMLMAGALIGMAVMAKYTGLYLWAAAGMYILIYNRAWLKDWSLWIAGLISVIIMLPILYWNVQNDWISFTFHGGRVVADNSFNWLYFGRELMGGIFYNNPINFVLIVCALVALFSNKFKSKDSRLLLIFSLPMILIFLGVSLTRETLPHWAAPAYFALILLVAQWLTNIKWAYASVGFTALVLVLGFVQINYGVINAGGNKDGLEIGRGDFTLDTYGWRQGGEKFAKLHEKYVEQGLMPSDASLVQHRWDDAAHIDSYFGLPVGLKTKAIGPLDQIHYYKWITDRRGGLNQGEDMYLISTSRFYTPPEEIFADKFQEIMPADTIKIYRGGDHVMNFYIHRLKGFVK